MVNRAKAASEEDGKAFLRQAFGAEQQVLMTQLDLSAQSITHAGKLGEVSERHFISLLKRYLPKRYEVDGAIVIDSEGSTSDQIDVVVFDPQYTPTLLDQEGMRFVLAEAVYCVIEVKSTVDWSNYQYAIEKAQSVRRLRRTSVGIVQASQEVIRKEPFPIIAGLVAVKSGWNEGFGGEAFQRLLAETDVTHNLDFGLIAEGGYFDRFDDDIKLGPDDNALAYFVFRLLMKLNSLGTVPAVDWDQYAKVFEDDT